MIRPCLPSDAPAICAIYNHYVRDTVVTFEEEPVADSDMEQRIRTVTSRLLWLAYEREGAIVGYAYAAPWHARSAYRLSAESTVYLSPACTQQGVGTQLYQALIAELRARRLHCIVGTISLPNAASVALHEKFGFTKAGHLSQLGWKFSRWVDVGYWQLML